VGDEVSKTDGGTSTDPERLTSQIGNLNAALKAERDALAAMKAQVATREKADADAEVARLQKAGEHKALYDAEKTAREALAARVAAYEAKEAARAAAAKTAGDAIVAGWAEADRTLDPAGLDPEARLDHVRRLDARLKGAGDHLATGTRTQGGMKAAIPAACLQDPSRPRGMDDDRWYTIWKGLPNGKKYAAGATKT